MQRLVEAQFQKCALASPDHILVATDLTDLRYLVPHAIAQAAACGAQVTFIHAIQSPGIAPIEIGGLSNGAASYPDSAKVVRDARLVLLGVERELEARGIICESTAHHGSANEVIRRELARTGATRLIVGTHGRGKLGQFVLGSVAHRLLTTSDVPVFVVGPHARTPEQHVNPRKILHPVSLMGNYRDSAQLAINIAQAYRAELTLLHIVDPNVLVSMHPGLVFEQADNALKALVPAATDLVPSMHTMVTFGEITEEILKVAGQIQSDWIVLGADSSYRFWVFNESVAYKALTAASCPVLTIREASYRAEIGDRGHLSAHSASRGYDSGTVSATR